MPGRQVHVFCGGTPDVNQIPSTASGGTLWIRVKCDETTVTVYCATTEGGLSSATARYTSTNFTMDGGHIGFYSGKVYIDNLSIKSDWNGDGTFDTVEMDDGFTLASHFAEQGPVHDAAGNMTYDGRHQYAYDAWGRLATVKRGYRDPDDPNTLTAGSTIATMKYDGLGRRMQKVIGDGDPNGEVVGLWYAQKAEEEARRMNKPVPWVMKEGEHW